MRRAGVLVLHCLYFNPSANLRRAVCQICMLSGFSSVQAMLFSVMIAHEEASVASSSFLVVWSTFILFGFLYACRFLTGTCRTGGCSRFQANETCISTWVGRSVSRVVRLLLHVVQQDRIPNADGLPISPQMRPPRGSEAAFVVFVLLSFLPFEYNNQQRLHGFDPPN